MKSKHFIIGFAAVAMIAALFSGCASAPHYNPALPVLAVSQAQYADIRPYGPSYESNPYMEPRTLIRGKLNEFFVVKLDFNLAVDAKITVIADATTLDGKEAAKAYDQYAFVSYWDANTSYEPDNDAKAQMRNTIISRSCIPSMSFTQRAGKSTLLMPMIGKNPIPRPAKLYVQVAASTGESVVFNFLLE
ncbi:MAG: hypothetical protein WC820_07135 [Spirochaetales bacterium]|jgi:hypothetical protein